jgi:hypothetical protein
MTSDELRATLDEWKANNKIFRLQIELVQDGINSLLAIVTDAKVTESEIRFSFGYGNLGGDVAIKISDDLSIEWLDPKAGLPSSGRCIKFAWKTFQMNGLSQHCIVCLQEPS